MPGWPHGGFLCAVAVARTASLSATLVAPRRHVRTRLRPRGCGDRTPRRPDAHIGTINGPCGGSHPSVERENACLETLFGLFGRKTGRSPSFVGWPTKSDPGRRSFVVPDRNSSSRASGSAWPEGRLSSSSRPPRWSTGARSSTDRASDYGSEGLGSGIPTGAQIEKARSAPGPVVLVPGPWRARRRRPPVLSGAGRCAVAAVSPPPTPSRPRRRWPGGGGRRPGPGSRRAGTAQRPSVGPPPCPAPSGHG